MVEGDTVSFGGTATLADKNVGLGKAVGVTGIAATGTDAGNYVLACWIPSPGEQAPHAMKGMLQALTVAPP